MISLSDMEYTLKKVEDGELNPLAAYIHLKKKETDLKIALELLKPEALKEAQKWSEKSFVAFGARVEKKSAPARYDFKHIQLIVDLKKRLSDIESKAKIGTFVDEESGEIVEKAFKIEGGETLSIEILD
jgi:hypothetical protein